MGFAKAEALLRRFRRPRWFRSRTALWSQRPQKRPYIFPTGFGFAFGMLAFIQLVMAIAAQNNLIYLFVFAEISIAIASMFYTNLNIHRVSLKSITAPPCFAQESNWIDVHLQTIKDQPIYQTAIRWNFEKESLWLPPTTLFAALSWTPRKRGVQRIPALVIESSYPFGLLRSWKMQRSDQEVLVFPCRRGNASFPSQTVGEQAIDNQGLFYDIRPFQRGDWPRRIDWRASQRAQKLLIRRYEEQTSMQLDFDWRQTETLKSPEERISQLALWVDKAEKQSSDYALRIGSWYSGRGRGPAHWHKCMEHLALLNIKDLR